MWIMKQSCLMAAAVQIAAKTACLETRSEVLVEDFTPNSPDRIGEDDDHLGARRRALAGPFCCGCGMCRYGDVT